MIIDTSFSCANRSSFLVTKGVTAVGRYYRVLKPERAITKEEARELSLAGIEIFVVYEDTGKFAELSLTMEQGAMSR